MINFELPSPPLIINFKIPSNRFNYALQENYFMDYDELCKAILEKDTKIRFSGVVNGKGDLTNKATRGDTESLLSPEEVNMSIHYTIERTARTKNLAHKIGNERSAAIEFDKVTLITIPFHKNELLIMSTEPGADYIKIINETKSLLENS